MKLCFYQRLALTLVVVFLAMMASIFALSTHYQSLAEHETEQRLHLGLAEYLVQENTLLREGQTDLEAIELLFQKLMVLGPHFEFYYLDPTGKVLVHSSENESLERQFVSLEPIKVLLQSQQLLPVFGDDPKQVDGQKVFSVSAINEGKSLKGFLYMIIGSEDYDTALAAAKDDQNIREFLMLVVSGLIFLLIALLILFKFFTAPLRQLSDDMDAIRDSDFSFGAISGRVNIWRRDSHNEVQRLGSAFTDMLAHIDRQFKQLQTNDTQRRQLLTQVAHDIRTPLASLQGYIETLSLNDDLSKQDRQRFVDIALRNARNLKRLIDQIFEWAYLDGGQVTLNEETFPTGELLYDVAAKFSSQTQSKEINLSISPSQCDHLVVSDLEKLERVLTNILDNAIRHTPVKGLIQIEVTPQQQQLRIDIRDSGVGIDPSEVKNIFEARYQASNCAQDKGIHVGLGLAISQRLVSFMHSEITVESNLNQGSCFSFALSMARSNN